MTTQSLTDNVELAPPRSLTNASFEHFRSRIAMCDNQDPTGHLRLEFASFLKNRGHDMQMLNPSDLERYNAIIDEMDDYYYSLLENTTPAKGKAFIPKGVAKVGLALIGAGTYLLGTMAGL